MLDNFSMLYFKLNIYKTNVVFLIFAFPILVKLKEKVMDNVPMPPKRPIPPRPPMKPQINRGVNENNPQATQAPTKPQVQVATQQTKVNTQEPTRKVEAKELSSAQSPTNENAVANQNNIANVQTAPKEEAGADKKAQVSPKPATKAEKKDAKQEDEKEGKNHSVLYLVLSGLCFAGAIACFVALFI